MPDISQTQYLLSLPPAMAEAFEPPEDEADRWFACSDPPRVKLGSAGGTANLLAQAWKATGSTMRFREWLRSSRKLIVHGGGQSRRLPAYSVVGKPFIPMPVIRRSYGQSMNQTLIDLQLPQYRSLLERASDETVVMITSGDLLLRFAPRISDLPSADVVAVGMPTRPEQAEHFGVFFTQPDDPHQIAFFLQKPRPDKIRELASRHPFLVDTGIWLMSERAVMALMERCGWDDNTQRFADGVARLYELYAGFGLSLGSDPSEPARDISSLSSAVVGLAEPQFYHMGTSRQLIESMTALQNYSDGMAWTGMIHPDQFILNSVFDQPKRDSANHTLWVENSYIASGWRLRSEHVLTGVPENDWKLELEAGACLDFVPIGESDVCVRAYGIDDSFSGTIGDGGATLCGRPLGEWLADRGIDQATVGIDPAADIYTAPLFPVLATERIDAPLIKWLFAQNPEARPDLTAAWVGSRRLSAEQIGPSANLRRLLDQRARLQAASLLTLYRKWQMSIFPRLDLQDTARLFVARGIGLPDDDGLPVGSGPLDRIHHHMFRSAVMRESGADGWQQEEHKSFEQLRRSIISESGLAPVDPERNVLDDQIIWGRSPARLDLAGGWTDTPPNCIEHGGKVVNVAVDLNGQPPVQVFAKLCPRPELVVRSIDLGVELKIHTYEELNTFAQPGSEFALAKAALAVAGFLPEFSARGGFANLEEQLRAFGGGIELSLLAAMPAGSGLGTSSILAATLLGTLSELCALNWDRYDLVSRTLAVEQMLTTGGGWQDQVGALFGGLKLAETTPGMSQRPTIRWLPDRLLSQGYANELAMLYYTGLTRLAKSILQEIVRGMFLNSSKRLGILTAMRDHALATFEAIQRSDWDDLCASVARSWVLNQELDSDTNPPAVQQILDRVQGDLAGAKLLGAGGGGYMLMLAKDRAAGERIRHKLEADPPNTRARFVDFSVSHTGLEVTRS